MSTSTPSRCCELALTLREGLPARFEVHRTGEVLTLTELVRRRPEGAVVLSAWRNDPPPETVVGELRAAGFRIATAFGPGTENDPWFRRDLGGEMRDDMLPKPPEFSYLPLPDTPEQRPKFPAPFRDGAGFVTIHNTAEPFSAFDERMRVANRKGVRTSFHFAADEREIVQLLPLGFHGWHAGDGDGNGILRSVGVEICRSVFRGENDWLYRRAEENASLLAAALLKVLKLTPAELRMHRDWSGKFCPHRILEDDSWDSFVSRVAAKLSSIAAHRLAGKLVNSLREPASSRKCFR